LTDYHVTMSNPGLGTTWMGDVSKRGTSEYEQPTTGDVQVMTYGEVGVKKFPEEQTPYLVGGSKHGMWQRKR